MDHPDQLTVADAHQDFRLQATRHQYSVETQLKALRGAHAYDLDGAERSVGVAYDNLLAALDVWRDDVTAAFAAIDRRKPAAGPTWVPPAPKASPPPYEVPAPVVR